MVYLEIRNYSALLGNDFPISYCIRKNISSQAFYIIIFGGDNVALFNERVKYLRIKNNITQKAIAEFLGTTERGYRNYEINKSTPNYETLLKLADYFNVSIDYLVGRSDNIGNENTARAKFAERLESLRIKKAITQREIAEYLDIHERTYQMYEHDKREPSHETTIKIANYFNVSADYLLGISDKPERQ